MRGQWLVITCLFVATMTHAQSGPLVDTRNITTGSIIPSEGYADQPYVVITNDGNWLCVLTTGKGEEGDVGQHIASSISTDQGKTWSPLVAIEPANGPEASWVMPLKVPSGRVYAIYTYNKNNVRQVESNNPRTAKRVDTMGVYAFKYTDDNGRSWSRERFEIPMRKMRIDRENGSHGEIMFFWGVGKPIVLEDSAIFGFAKVGRWGDPGVLVESQGTFMRSENILTEKDPNKIKWELLPDGDSGLRAPKGPVSEEANLVSLSNGTLYATYRTIDGYNCHAYSSDNGHTWTGPEYATYSPGGRRIKHPRAANFVRKFSNGKFLLWYHNQGGEAVHASKFNYYVGRNPGWISGGVEKNGKVYWSEPEILLYEDTLEPGISYPDFVEDRGRFFITETQKSVARLHEIDRTLLEGVWNQSEEKQVSRNGLVLTLNEDGLKPGSRIKMPRLPLLNERRGFSIDMWVWLNELTAGQVLLDARDTKGKGIQLSTSDRYTLKLSMNDGVRESSWDSDPGTHPGTLKIGQWQHVAIIVDGGPKIISFVVDGVFNDGGAVRQFGFGRFAPELGDINGSDMASLPKFYGSLKKLRIYDRYLRTSEAVGNFRAGP